MCIVTGLTLDQYPIVCNVVALLSREERRYEHPLDVGYGVLISGIVSRVFNIQLLLDRGRLIVVGELRYNSETEMYYGVGTTPSKCPPC